MALSLWVVPVALEAQEAALDPALSAAMRSAAPSDRMRVLIEFEDKTGAAPAAAPRGVFALQRRAQVLLAPLAEPVKAGELQIQERFWVVPAALAKATPAAIAELARRPGVRRIYLDERLPVRLEPSVSLGTAPQFVSEALRTIGADAVWAGGVTGSGTTVAIFDTGVDGRNALLADRWRGRRTSVRASWFDPFRRASEPQDLIGHGTLVASAAVGALPAGDTLVRADGTRVVAVDGLDVVTGPAPEAEWIAARIFDNFGGNVFTRRSVILQAFQWALDPDGDPSSADEPDVISNSWGTFTQPGQFDACTDIIFTAVDAAEAAGIAVIFAAGNGGPASGSVAFPASRDDPQLRSLAVGATEGTGTSLTVASFSGRGPSACGGGIKPELVAPGRIPEVIAAGPGTARLTGFTVKGTSFSTPQVAGALALMRQLQPGVSPEQAKRFLLNSARDLGVAGADNESGFGLLDVPAAVAQAGGGAAVAFLQFTGAHVDGSQTVLALRNRGMDEFPGGWLEIEGSAGAGERVSLAAIGPGEERSVRLRPVAMSDSRVVHAVVFDLSGSVLLSRSLVLTPPGIFGGFILTAGALNAGANNFGRMGQVAAFKGFEWRGEELLPSASFVVAGGGRLSDGMYSTVEGRPALKTQPPAVETDWAPSRSATDVQPASADVRFDDFEALTPVGVEVSERLEASESGGVGALALTARIRNASGARIQDLTPGVFADWDLNGGEMIRWSPELRALIAEPIAGGGPVTLLAGDTTEIAFTSVPLGTPGSTGFYDAGSGVLATEFAETDKIDLVRGLPADGLPGAGTATDQASLLSVGPLDLAVGNTAVVRFWLLVADSESEAGTRLAELRAAAPPAPPSGGRFKALFPFPNPLRIGQGRITFPFDLPAPLRTAGAKISFELYDVAGRRILRQRFPVDAAASLPVLTWDGRLKGGRQAAAGVYLYVFRLQGAVSEVQSGRVMVVR